MSNANAQYTNREVLDAREAAQPLANYALRNNIRIGLNVTAKVAFTRPERERIATLWFGNYINRENLGTHELMVMLGVDRAELNGFLSNPDADVKSIVGKVESLRRVLDANLQEPAQTEFCKMVTKAFRFAMAEGGLVEVIDITRSGKTTVADWVHLKNLDRAIYVTCPDSESYASFIVTVAKACGISISSGKRGKKTHVLEAQIREMFARGLFNLLILDEGHYLWPTNIARKPKRIEFLRSLWDEKKRQVAVVILSTPQALLSINQAKQRSERWAPGQWEGRIVRFVGNREVTADDREKVARWHCPEGSVAIIKLMSAFAKITPGFYGTMVDALRLARFEANEAGVKLNVEILAAAQDQAARGTQLEKELEKKGLIS